MQTDQSLSILVQTLLRCFKANILGVQAWTCTNTDLVCLDYELSGAMTFSSDVYIHFIAPALP